MTIPEQIPTAPEIIKSCYRPSAIMVAKLLAEGVDINAIDERDNLTCLHIACNYNYGDIVDVILAHDAIHHTVDFGVLSKYRPRTAWQHAQDSGYHELAEKVWQAGQRSERRAKRLVLIEKRRSRLSLSL